MGLLELLRIKRQSRPQTVVIANVDVHGYAGDRAVLGIRETPHGLEASALIAALHEETRGHLPKGYSQSPENQGIEVCTFDDHVWTHGEFLEGQHIDGKTALDAHLYKVDAKRNGIALRAELQTTQDPALARLRISETAILLSRADSVTTTHVEEQTTPTHLEQILWGYQTRINTLTLQNPLLQEMPELFLLHTGTKMLEMYRLINAGNNKEGDKPTFNLWFGSEQPFQHNHFTIYHLAEGVRTIKVAEATINPETGIIKLSYLGLVAGTPDHPTCNYDHINKGVRAVFGVKE